MILSQERFNSDCVSDKQRNFDQRQLKLYLVKGSLLSATRNWKKKVALVFRIPQLDLSIQLFSQQ